MNHKTKEERSTRKDPAAAATVEELWSMFEECAEQWARDTHEEAMSAARKTLHRALPASSRKKGKP